MLNFNFSEKSLGLVSPPYFVYGFSRKIFFMLYSLNWPNLIPWLLLFLKIFCNTCIIIICLPGGDVLNFGINLIFLIRPFYHNTKRSRQKLKYLENKKSFWGEIKKNLIIIKGLSVVKNCLRPNSAPLN